MSFQNEINWYTGASGWYYCSNWPLRLEKEMYSLWRRHVNSQQLLALLKSLQYLLVAQQSNRDNSAISIFTTILNAWDFLSHVFTYDSPSGKRVSNGHILGSVLSVLIRTFHVYFYCNPTYLCSRYHNRCTHYIVRGSFIFLVDISPCSLLFTHRVKTVHAS